MYKTSVIEDAIIHKLDPAKFQELCDNLLSKIGKYGIISSLGKQPGFSKTTKGTPDTYFFNECSGKYVFVEYTMQEKDIYKKINEDLKKCLDPNVTGVELNDIEEIIYCHTSSNLTPGQDKALRDLCDNCGVKLSLYGVNYLAQEISLHYPILARDYLEISIDTNQIMSIEDFIKVHDANKTAAPLNTKFIDRHKDLETLIDYLKVEQIVIVYGNAGVGKTRIALEAARIFSENSKYQLLCVKSNNLDLVDDLAAYTEKPGEYLFLIDDANELNYLNLFFNYITKNNRGYTVKFLITVRDYAKESVIQISNKYVSPFLYEITPFSNYDIGRLLIDSLMGNDIQHYDAIIECAKGNPRIAYMAYRVLKEVQPPDLFKDFRSVYDEYYGSVVKHELNRELCFTVGILSFLHTINIDELENLKDILEWGNLTEKGFRVCIHSLREKGFAGLNKGSIAYVLDRGFADYILYYEFLKMKSIPLSPMIATGFKYYRDGILDSINTVLKFYPDDKKYIIDEVKKVWEQYEKVGDKYYHKFIEVFHRLNPNEAFIRASELINQLKDKHSKEENIGVLNLFPFPHNDEVLNLLTGYSNTEYMVIVIELLISYISISQLYTFQGFGWLIYEYGTRHLAQDHSYNDENIIIDTLMSHLCENSLINRFAIAYAGNLISFKEQLDFGVKTQAIKISPFSDSSLDDVIKCREKCWNILIRLMNINDLRNEIIEIIEKYAESINGFGKSTFVIKDKPYVIEIAQGINCSIITRANIFTLLENAWNEKVMEFHRYPNILESKEWDLYNRLEVNDIFYLDGYEDELSLWKNGVINFAKSIPKNEINNTFEILDNLANDDTTGICWTINNGVEIILSGIIEDSDKVKNTFEVLVTRCHYLNLNPRQLLVAVFKQLPSKDIWDLINANASPMKNKWRLCYFETLPIEYVDASEYNKMLFFFKNEIDYSDRTNMPQDTLFLEKYRNCDPNIYVTVSKIILAKRKHIEFARAFFEDIFNVKKYTPSKLLQLYSLDLKLLEIIYLYLLKNSVYVDKNGCYFECFLAKDDSWFKVFVDTVFAKEYLDPAQGCRIIESLWRSDSYMEYIDYIFEVVNHGNKTNIEIMQYTFPQRGYTDLFIEQRQTNWIKKTMKNATDIDTINTLFCFVSETTDLFRIMVFNELLKRNDDFEFFKNIQICSFEEAYNEESYIEQLQRNVEYLESLLTELHGAKYIQHVNHLQKLIKTGKELIEQENTEGAIIGI